MLMIKTIHDIEPFNEVFYRTCFYNSFIPIVRSYGSPILPFFIHEIPIYSFNTNDLEVHFDIHYRSNRDLETLLTDANLYIQRKLLNGHIVEDLIEAIGVEHPVVIWIDSYYLPLRSDTYRKQHWPHSLLIYGYNQFDETFQIIEHHRSDALTYEKRIIDQSDLEAAYSGYGDHFMKSGEYTFFEFEHKDFVESSKIGKSEITDFLSVYKNNVKKEWDSIIEGIEHIPQIQQYLYGLVHDETILKKKIHPLMDRLTSIVNAKKAEQYKMEALAAEEKLTVILKEIILLWTHVRAVFVKYSLTLDYKIENLMSSIGKMKEIMKLEQIYWELLSDRRKIIVCGGN